MPSPGDTLNGSYINKINILENKNGTVIVQNINLGTHTLYKLVCASGKIEMTPISIPISYDNLALNPSDITSEMNISLPDYLLEVPVLSHKSNWNI